MAVVGSRSDALRAMATNLRHAAAETGWPDYRKRLVEVARDLEREADESDKVPSARDSRAG